MTEDQKIKVKFTTTTLFILPMYGLPVKEYDKVGFINSFFKYTGKDDKVPLCYMVFFDAPLWEEGINDLITMFEAKTGIGVILNTSFNVNRMPILSTLKDAFNMFENTQMDTLIIENDYIRKYMKL